MFLGRLQIGNDLEHLECQRRSGTLWRGFFEGIERQLQGLAQGELFLIGDAIKPLDGGGRGFEVNLLVAAGGVRAALARGRCDRSSGLTTGKVLLAHDLLDIGGF